MARLPKASSRGFRAGGIDLSGHSSVIVVGGGIMGAQAALQLSRQGHMVTVLDQFDAPNQWAGSGDHLRAFRMGNGSDAFFTEMAVKSLPFWLELNKECEETLLFQNGALHLAVKNGGVEDKSAAVLKERRVKFERLDPQQIKRAYPMYSRAVKWALFEPEGGMIWASRAVSAVLSLAQRKGARVRSNVRITSIIKDKHGIRAVKDDSGKSWPADKFVFTPGFWTGELLKSYGIPMRVTKQEQIFLRPLVNRGRYRAEHFPPFICAAGGFYGFPIHIHGFIKIGANKLGPRVMRPNLADLRTYTPGFEKSARRFLKKFAPELGAFNEFEGHVGWFDNTLDGDFIVDRLPDAPNAVVAAGFSGHGFKFAPLIGQSIAELLIGGKSELNLHRFRITRFKLRVK